jgi:hypothetical protein
MTRFRRVFPLLGPIRPVIAGPIKAAGKRIFGDTAIDTIRSGNWHGNDTTWRMVLDLTRILMYADAARTLHDTPVRRFLSVVDGIIAGEGNGPLDATPRPAGIVLAGTNPVAVDCACARLMGFDINRLPVIQHAFEPHRYPIVSDEPLTLKCRTNHDPGITDLEALTPLAPPFKPHFGWRGAVELDTASQPADSGSRR